LEAHLLDVLPSEEKRFPSDSELYFKTSYGV